MRPDVLAAVLAGMLTAGIVLVVAALRGTTAPPGPPSRTAMRLRRWWHGTGQTRAQTRARRFLLAAAVAAGIATWFVFRVPVAAILGALVVPGVPWLLGVGKAELRAIARLEAVGQWIRRLNDRLGTGQGLQAAIVASASNAPPAVQAEVQALANELNSGVVPAEQALRRFADVLDDMVIDQVVAALLLHLSDRGERLSTVLSAIADSTAREVVARRQIAEKRKEPRNTVIFMAVFGLGVFGFVLVNEDLIGPYRTAVGQIVMAAVIAIYVALLAWTRKMNAPRSRPRILVTAQQAERG